MRKGIISALIGTALFLGACSPTIDPVGPEDKTFNTTLENNKTRVRSNAIIIAGTYLLMVEGDRGKVAKDVETVSIEIQKALNQGQLSTKDVQSYAVDLLANSDSKDKELVGLVLNSVATEIRSSLNLQFKDLTVEVRDSVAKDLALSAIDGVLQVTNSYKGQ